MYRRLAPGLLAAAVLALASTQARADVEDILLEDGRTVRAEILEVRDDGLKLKGRVKGGGTAEMVVRADQLDAEWYYGIRDRAAGNDARAHLKLAMWAIERDLFSRARAQIQRATELDPKLVKDIKDGTLPGVRDGIAAKVLASARADMKAGHPDRALRKTELLLARAPDTPAGAEAADFLPEIEAAVAAKEKSDLEAERAKLAEDARKAEAERDALLEPVEEKLAKGKALGSASLLEDNQPKAIGMLGDALKMGEAALERLDDIAKQKAGDETITARVTELRGRITAAMVKGYLHKAEMYFWRGSLPNAKEELEKLEKLDPGNADAASLTDRIADTEQDNSDEQRWRRDNIGGESRFGGRRGGGGGGRR